MMPEDRLIRDSLHVDRLTLAASSIRSFAKVQPRSSTTSTFPIYKKLFKMSGARHWEQDKDSTVYIGNLDERCSDALVWELMLQAGPVINVHLPKDRVTQIHQGYGFVEFGSEDDADYAVKIMNQIRVWGKPLRVNKASADKRSAENGGPGAGQSVGAELFVGNLDPGADEKVLYDTFSRFGPLVGPPKIARDEANLSKGYGFVSYSAFEHSDDAIEHMHGQYLMNKEVTVQYAYKKDGKGERHGDAAERSLAAQARKHGVEVQIPALPAALVMPQSAPNAPIPMNGYASAPNGMPPRPSPQPPPNFAGYGGYGPPGYNAMAPPTSASPMANGTANRQYNQSPLQMPPNGAGLPARPPPSMPGYGASGMPQNFPGPPPPSGFPPSSSPPPGMPPPGMPPGFRPPTSGAPPNNFPPPR